MEINNNTIINVCSYMPITVIASTSVEDYVFEPCQTDNPIIIPMSAVEIKEIHSKSRVFADGWLSFEDDVKDDMYKFLKIKDSQNILNQIEVMNCIISGKKEDVEKLINIKSKGYFERVYGVYTALKQSNMYDISMRVAKALEYRYKELQNGIINTKIELSDSFQTDEKDKTINKQEQLLKEQDEQLNSMNKTIATLEQKIAELTKVMGNSKDNKVVETDKSIDTQSSNVTPRRGRKPATTTK